MTRATRVVAAQQLTLREAVALNLRRVQAVTGPNGQNARALRSLFQRALDDLHRRMLTLRRERDGMTAFSTAQAQAVEAQLRHVIRDLTAQLEGYRAAGVRRSAAAGLTDLSRTVRGLEAHYAGLDVPLGIDEAARFEGLVDGVARSVMRLHPESSMQAYGDALVRRWEDYFAVAAANKAPVDEVVNRVLAAAQEPGLLQGHNYGAPTFERWRAERIVRTEFMEALNGAKLAGTEALIASGEMPDLRMQLLEHFDDRTSWDSYYAHGQVRKPGELFEDGAGRKYAHPPGRPNDRGFLVPWRKAWAESAKVLGDGFDDDLDPGLPGGLEAAKRGRYQAPASMRGQ